MSVFGLPGIAITGVSLFILYTFYRRYVGRSRIRSNMQKLSRERKIDVAFDTAPGIAFSQENAQIFVIYADQDYRLSTRELGKSDVLRWEYQQNETKEGRPLRHCSFKIYVTDIKRPLIKLTTESVAVAERLHATLTAFING